MESQIYYAMIGHEFHYTRVMVGRDPEQLMLASRECAQAAVECSDCLDETADDVQRLEGGSEEWAQEAVDLLTAVEEGRSAYLDGGWLAPEGSGWLAPDGTNMALMDFE